MTMCSADPIQLISSIGKLAAVAEIKSKGNSAERRKLLVGRLGCWIGLDNVDGSQIWMMSST
jgi:hypothetical protein